MRIFLNIIPLFQYSNIPCDTSGDMKDIVLKVYLQPKSSKNEIIGPYRDGIKVKVTTPPSEGKANEALIRLLAKELGIPVSNIEILKGHHSREKTLKIAGSSDSPLQKST
jgi:uncharacterized protein (TIGR00251 family)